MLAAPTPRTVIRPAGEAESQSIVLEGISWELYERLCKELVETHVRITYDDGRMEIMTPPIENPHEQHKKFLARLIETYALFNRLDITGIGSALLRKKELRKGIEPDECYYVKSKPPPVKARKILDKGYSPPDLGIEIDDTSSSIPRQPIYAAIGIPEVWRVKNDVLAILHLQSNGKYKEVKKSIAFPDLTSADLNRFFKLSLETSQSHAIHAFWDWLQETK
jgi:Uma2 family endonuclease